MRLFIKRKNNLNKFFKAFFSLVLCLFSVENSYASNTDQQLNINFNTEAKQAILVDFNSNSVLFEKNSTEKMFPSSMTKVLTMFVVFDHIKKGLITLDTEYLVSQKAWKTGGSQMFLKVGDKVKVGDLIQGVIVQSGNDACVTLAEGIDGSVENFVNEMNQYAKDLGMLNTHFDNPDGLPTQNHFTTAKDLSIVARRLITDFPEHYHYYSQREFSYGGISQQNRNKLLDIPDLGVDGMKTGFTEMGGYGIIATGVKEGRRLIAVVNGLESNAKRLNAAEELLRFGFNNFKNIKLFSKYTPVDKIRVFNGVDDYVTVAPQTDIEVLVNRKDTGAESYKTQIAFKEPWVAPIKQGTNMATLVIKDSSGNIIQQQPLFATKDVAEAGVVKKLLQKISYLFEKL
jgi:D-alanyl-D-alanine carboxypeptidase (penicillin-binding protein 5/6)